MKGWHNGRWAACPQDRDRDPDKLEKFKPYIQEVIRAHRTDKRVLWWEIFNEPQIKKGQFSERLRRAGYLLGGAREGEWIEAESARRGRSVFRHADLTERQKSDQGAKGTWSIQASADSEPECFDHPPPWQAEEIPLGDGRTLVHEGSWLRSKRLENSRC